MLQQTRVEVVIPRYLRFLERFPDLRSLARAREDAVVAEWSGLGYYSRARALHAAAGQVLARHGGEFPRNPAAARALPGIGPYTAGAILSIAYNLPEPIVDGNVERVLTRLFRIGGDPKASRVRARITALARELIPEAKASEFNQSMMELGALICLPASPRCRDCPLAELCKAHRSGLEDRYPEARARRIIEDVRMAAAVIRRGSRVLLEQRGRTGPAYLKGLWGFPAVELRRGEGPEAVVRHLRDAWGIEGRPGPLLGEVRHSITFRRITVQAWRFESAGTLLSRAVKGPDGGRLAWRDPMRLGADLPASSLDLKLRKIFLERRNKKLRL